ncbi:MAG: hypothetical protein ACTHKK_07040, partial [Candidatus Nitrosocosmicus sp.]
MKNNNNNNSYSRLNTTSIFRLPFLISIFGLILITSTLSLNTSTFAVFAQSNSTIPSRSDNQTSADQLLCKLPPEELIRILHGQHISC